MLNQVTIIGRLGAAPEVKNFDSGNQVATMNVASWESYFDKNKPNDNGSTGAWETITEWHRVVMWGKSAERCAKMDKGDLVMVTGKVKTRQWEDKNGNKQYTTEIVGFVKAMPNGAGKSPANNPDDSHDDYSSDAGAGNPGDGEGDLPF